MDFEEMSIVIPIFVFQKTGGMRVLTRLADQWSNLGCRVEFIVSDSSASYFQMNDNVIITNLNVENRLRRYFALGHYMKINFDNYNIIIANQNGTTLPVYYASKKNNDYSKNWYYIQAYESEFYSKKSIKNFVKKIISNTSYRLPFTKIVNSDIYKDYKLVHTNKVVYPGLDLDNYYSKDTSYFNPVIKVGTIGRTEAWKGTRDVCKAMELLKSEDIKFEFYIAFNDFETIPHHFVKPDGDENLSSFYRDMDIVVAACKGQHGAIHYPVIETMAVGSSIICTDYYPANESNAYKVEESAPKQIAEAIKQIINNKDEAIKKREQAIIDVQQFDWPIIAKKFLDYLKKGRDENDYAE